MLAKTVTAVFCASLIGQGVVGSAVAERAFADPSEAAPVARAAKTSWGPTIRVASNPRGEAAVIDRQGVATIIWADWKVPHAVKVIRHRPGEAWSEPRTIGHGYAPQVVADRKGRVTAAWITQRKGYTDGVVTARRRLGGGWSTPVRLTNDRRVASYPDDGEDAFGAVGVQLAVNPAGDVVAVWSWGSYARHKPWRLQSASRLRGQPWTEAVRVTPATGASDPKVGLDSAGTTTLVYERHQSGHPTAVLQRTLTRGGTTWSAATTLVTDSSDVVFASGVRGGAIIAFTQDYQSVLALTRAPGGEWSEPVQVSGAGVDVTDFAVTTDAHERGIVAMGGGFSGWVDLAAQAADGTWTEPVRMVSEASQVSQVLVSGNRVGDLFLGWGGYDLNGQYRPAGGAWGDAVTLSPETQVDVLESTVAQTGRTGDVVVLWEQEGRPLKARLLTAS